MAFSSVLLDVAKDMRHVMSDAWQTAPLWMIKIVADHRNRSKRDTAIQRPNVDGKLDRGKRARAADTPNDVCNVSI